MDHVVLLVAAFAAGSLLAVAALSTYVWPLAFRSRRGPVGPWRIRRVRRCIAVAWDDWEAGDLRRALTRARRATRLAPRSPGAHAVLAACLNEVDKLEAALKHHRMAEALAEASLSLQDTTGTWRFENALGAARVCMKLRGEAHDGAVQKEHSEEAQRWMQRAGVLDPVLARDEARWDPWLPSGDCHSPMRRPRH